MSPRNCCLTLLLTAACCVSVAAQDPGAPASEAEAVKEILRQARAMEREEPQKARDLLEAARKQHPAQTVLVAELVGLEAKAGAVERIVTLLRVGMQPPLVQRYGPSDDLWRRGMTGLETLERWDVAEQLSREALQRWPAHWSSIHQRLRALIMLGRSEEAVIALEAYLRDRPSRRRSAWGWSWAER